MTDFKSYMRMNVYYEYLQKYYNSDDIASIYGIDKFEIKHSNVLRWILEPKNHEAIDYLPIRNLLRFIQNNNLYYDFLKQLDLDMCIIEDVKVQREKYNIDLFITFKIDKKDYMIIIENKLESITHDNQLEVYKTKVSELYKSYKKLYVFLHPGYHINPTQESVVNDSKYISITYQEIYDYILKNILDFTVDSTVKFIVYYYIHTLCCYYSNNLIGLIVTDEEKVALKLLFEDTEILKMIDSLYTNQNNEYTNYYKENKSTFIQIFNKYLYIIEDKILKNKIEKILKTKSYIMNGISYNGISELLLVMFDKLLNQNTFDELKELIYLVSKTDPLLVSEQDLINVEHKNWYLKNPKILKYDNNKYYILSAWSSKEYDDLKNKFNELKKDSSEIYYDITLE